MMMMQWEAASQREEEEAKEAVKMQCEKGVRGDDDERGGETRLALKLAVVKEDEDEVDDGGDGDGER